MTVAIIYDNDIETSVVHSLFEKLVQLEYHPKKFLAEQSSGSQFFDAVLHSDAILYYFSGKSIELRAQDRTLSTLARLRELTGESMNIIPVMFGDRDVSERALPFESDLENARWINHREFDDINKLAQTIEQRKVSKV